jgi:cell division septation protein DedD
MSTGLLTGRRSMSMVLALTITVMVLASLSGCGKENQDDQDAQPEPGALVPGGNPDTTAVDTTAGIVSESAYVAGTLTETEGVTENADSSDQAPPVPEVKEVRKEKTVTQTEARPSTSTTSSDGAYSLQLGSFTSLANARNQADRISELGYSPVIEESTLGGETYHRVMLRGVGDMAAASQLGEHIHSKLGIAYLVRRGN